MIAGHMQELASDLELEYSKLRWVIFWHRSVLDGQEKGLQGPKRNNIGEAKLPLNICGGEAIKREGKFDDDLPCNEIQSRTNHSAFETRIQRPDIL
jgi:hypothetical protein